MKRRRMNRGLLWMAVLCLMTVIFAFSAQHGTASDEMTSVAVMPLVEMMASMQEGDTMAAIDICYSIVGTIVRKLAHVCEYALLGYLVHQLMCTYGLRIRWLPILFCVAYAVTDEIHQAFVPGRSGRATDVLIDSVGVFAGVYAPAALLAVRQKLHNPKR